MAFERRSFAGGAISTTLSAPIGSGDMSIPITSSTGWPSGSAGDFFVVIDKGTATEEKVRIDTRSSETLTVQTSGRGADGTTAASHTAGATIDVCVAALDLDEANAHIANTALDHHTQYLNSTRHDVEARHTFGAALGTPVTPAPIGTAAAGTGDNPSREDHVHAISNGTITPAMFSVAHVRMINKVIRTTTTSLPLPATDTLLTGMSITHTCEASKTYRLSFTGSFDGVTSDYIRVTVFMGSTVVSEAYITGASGGGNCYANVSGLIVPGAGSKTFTVQAFGATASGDLWVVSASHPSCFALEDMG